MKQIHVSYNVRGLIKELARSRKHLSFFSDSDTGAQLTRAEALDNLLDMLSKGIEVMPATEPACEGFDYSGGGCPGHPADGGD